MLESWETLELQGRRFVESPRPDAAKHLPPAQTSSDPQTTTHHSPNGKFVFGMQLAVPLHRLTLPLLAGPGEETA